MKITFTCLAIAFLAFGSLAQAPLRVSLYEEFASENGPVSYPVDTTVNAVLANNSTKVIPIKWMTAIPSAPTATL